MFGQSWTLSNHKQQFFLWHTYVQVALCVHSLFEANGQPHCAFTTQLKMNHQAGWCNLGLVPLNPLESCCGFQSPFHSNVVTVVNQVPQNQVPWIC